MDFGQLVRSRRTVHNYNGDVVPDALVREALTLGLWSPNHRLTFPIRYVQVGPAAREELTHLALELKGAREPLSEVKRQAIADSLAKPSHLVALALKNSPEPMVAHEDYATLGAAVQNIGLFLWERGVATKWSTAGWSMNERAYAILGLNPEIVRLEGCLMIGHARNMPIARERPALDEIFVTTR